MGEISSISSLAMEKRYFVHDLGRELSLFFKEDTENKEKDVSFFLDTMANYIELFEGIITWNADKRQKLQTLIADLEEIVKDNNIHPINDTYLNACKFRDYI